MKSNKIKIGFVMAMLSLLPACTKSCGKKQGAEPAVSFEAPKNNESVTSPFEVKFAVRGLSVRPAMENIDDTTSGHHHILIDHPTGFIEKGQAIPADSRHIHYGKGEESALLELSPGIHTLSLQFADGAHRSYGKELSATITVTVAEKTP